MEITTEIFLIYVLPAIAAGFMAVAYPILKKKAKETETVLDDKILDFIGQSINKWLGKNKK